MQAKELQQLTLDSLNDLKAIDIVTYDVHNTTSITDFMIICSGRSTTHVKAIAESLIEKAKKNHVSYIKSEGKREGEWAVVDLADVIVHIMLPATRSFYNLEDLWEPIKQMREKQG